MLLRAVWLSLLGFALCAAPVHASPTSVTVAVIENSPDRIVVEYRIGPYTQRMVDINGATYAHIALTGESPIKVCGAPELPNVCRSLIIPDDAAMSVTVLSSEYHDVRAIDVAPSKGYVWRSVNPANVPYTLGAPYGVDAFYPGPLAALRDPHILRDLRGAVLEINPFQYNPVQRVLRVHTELVIEVARIGKGKRNVFQRPDKPRPLSRAFHDIYGSHFINYRIDKGHVPLTETGAMIIIVHDPWVDHVQPLADHKVSIGLDATVVGVSTIGNTEQDIADFIQAAYDAPDSELAFVLLVGDAAEVAPAYYGDRPADPIYALVAGDDDYPDIIIGRFSAETADEVDTQVDRTIAYEQLPATQQDWFWRGMGIGSDQGPGDDAEFDFEHIDHIRDKLLDYGYTFVDKIYAPTATSEAITEGLNAGRGIVNYTGHGSPVGWSTGSFNNDDVNALTNVGKLPFILSLACNPGHFDVQTCFGEAWLRATDDSRPTGAIGIYAASMSQYWFPPMEAHDEFIRLYTSEEYTTYGALCFAGSCAMLDDYDARAASMFKTWILFGDPSLRVVGVAAPPSGMVVTPSAGPGSAGPIGGPFVPQAVTYTLRNLESIPIAFTISHDAAWIDVSDTEGQIPAEGKVDVVISINPFANALPYGRYEDTITITNQTTAEGDTIRVFTLEVLVPPVPVHVFDLNDDPGWTTSGAWEFGQPTGQGGDSYGHPDPVGGATGDNVYGCNLIGDYEIEVNGPHYLTTTAIDCCALTQTTLHYQRWLNTDYLPYIRAALQVSVDNVNWKWLSWQNGYAVITDDAWLQQVFDIAAVADQQRTVYVRWGHEVLSEEAFPFSGWNLDDIELWGGLIPAGDFNADGCIDGDDLAALGNCFTGTAGTAERSCQCKDLDIDGDVDCDDWQILLAAWTSLDTPPDFPRCMNTAIPTTTEWGLVIMSSLLAVAATTAFTPRRVDE